MKKRDYYIFGVLTNEWQVLRQLASKLKITDITEGEKLNKRLFELKNKGEILCQMIDGRYHWKLKDPNTIKKIIFETLLKFSKKFSRIYLQELVDEVQINEAEVKEIVKDLIKKEFVSANYDDSSNGIQFLIMEKKIDELLTKFENWGKEDKTNNF